MAANPSITIPNLIPSSEQAETGKVNPMRLLQRIEALLDKAFGDTEENIANSLRGL
jgi:hypothetical protein